MVQEVSRKAFDNLVQRVEFLEAREAERAQIAHALATQGEESARRAAERRAQQAGQGVNSLPIVRSV